VPRSRAAPLNDPAGVVQRVGMVHHADRTHFVRPSTVNRALTMKWAKVSPTRNGESAGKYAFFKQKSRCWVIIRGLTQFSKSSKISGVNAPEIVVSWHTTEQ